MCVCVCVCVCVFVCASFNCCLNVLQMEKKGLPMNIRMFFLAFGRWGEGGGVQIK